MPEIKLRLIYIKITETKPANSDNFTRERLFKYIQLHDFVAGLVLALADNLPKITKVRRPQSHKAKS